MASHEPKPQPVKATDESCIVMSGLRMTYGELADLGSIVAALDPLPYELAGRPGLASLIKRLAKASQPIEVVDMISPSA